ncbi:LysR family transcriptional regulator [Aliamphritea ceti]|uniref:LysR family transcriptional regulator n=1 Tax=Aliamphritea ceti TaxID=1524258 RepID=UPI0021C33572|nr:LysR family transcriptional regulator [Aliamphritea ceti]
MPPILIANKYLMDIDALRSFIAFVDTGSFTRAAKQTFRTQGAVSMQMKKLEEETGRDLFTKDGRNLSLTDDGRKLVSYARRILALHDEALGEFSHSSGMPPLRIGCPDDYAQEIFPDLVALLLTEYPQLQIRLLCDNSNGLRQALDQGKIDLAILTRAPDKEEGYLLRHDKGVWVHAGFPELQQYAELPLVLYEADCKFHSSAVDGLEKQGQRFRVVCASSSATAIKSLLRRGMGIGVLASSTIDENLVPCDRPYLPTLPMVDIVLAVAPTPHPLVSTAMAQKISQKMLSQTAP